MLAKITDDNLPDYQDLTACNAQFIGKVNQPVIDEVTALLDMLLFRRIKKPLS